MKTLQLINSHRDSLGQIIWEPQGEITVEIQDPKLATDIKDLLARARVEGLPLRSGGQVEKEGKMVFVDRVDLIRYDDVRFLRAVAEKICQIRFGNCRVFGLLKEERADHAGI